LLSAIVRNPVRDASESAISIGAETPESLLIQAGGYAALIFQPLLLRHLFISAFVERRV
jgi:hypothetical protein